MPRRLCMSLDDLASHAQQPWNCKAKDTAVMPFVGEIHGKAIDC